MDNSEKLKNSIVDQYIDETLTTGLRPISIYKFCEKLKISELDFYNNFSSFKAIEAQFWSTIVHQTLKIIENDEIEEDNTHHYLLSFYYTLFENLKLNRSFILFLTKNNKAKLQVDFKLKKVLKPHLSNISKNIHTPLHSISEEVGERISEEGIWIQFITIFHFWLRDESLGFEKTDLFIEKSTRAGIDLTENIPTESIIDLGKFIFKEFKKII